MFMGGIYYWLFNSFSLLFPNMHISKCIIYLYVSKLENNNNNNNNNGLEVNPTKSEVSNDSCDNFQSVLLAIE